MKLLIIFLFFSMPIFAEEQKVDDALQILNDISEPEIPENQILEKTKPVETPSGTVDNIIEEPAGTKVVTPEIKEAEQETIKAVQDSEEIKQIDTMMEKAEEEIKTQNTDFKEPELKNTGSAFGADEYDTKEKESLDKLKPYSIEEVAGNENLSGDAGSWLLNVLYESAAYEGYTRQHGLEIEYAWVYDFRYVAVHALANFGYYKGVTRATGFFPLGLGAELMFGIPSWFFISGYYGMEYAKQEASDYFTFTKSSIGLYFDLSTVSKESQFQLYRNHGIRRTYLVIKYQQRNNSELDLYSQKSISLGFGFEY